MRALLCTGYGRPPSIEMGTVDELALRPGEVRVAVEAVGIGYFDAVFLSGQYQERPELPFIIGRELAGTVIEAAADVDPSLVGRHVAAASFTGACAERVVVAEAHCLWLPDGMDVLVGAAALNSYATALYGLEDCGRLVRGERVLVLGASGTVGLAAIDVARALGATVIAMASTEEKRQFCLARGANIALDSVDPQWRRQLTAIAGSVDVVVDPVGGAWSEAAFRSLAPGGRHLVVGFAAGEIARLPLNLCLLKRASAVGVNWGGFMQAEPAANRDLLARLAVMLADGRLDPQLNSVHSSTRLLDVLDDFLARRSVGKPVLRLAWDEPYGN